MNERHGRLHTSSSDCSTRHHASLLMLQGVGLRRRQVTWISIKGIIAVETAERKKQHASGHTDSQTHDWRRQREHK